MIGSLRCELCGQGAHHVSPRGLDVCDEHLATSFALADDAVPERTHDWLSGGPLHAASTLAENDDEEEDGDDDDPPTAVGALCRSFDAGHHVHWVQALRAARDHESPYVPAQILRIDLNGWIVLAIQGETVRLWTHDPERITFLNDQSSAVSLNSRWSALRIGSRPISVTSSPTPCVFEAPSGTLIEQLERHGGFTVSGAQAFEELGPSTDGQ